MVSTKMVSQPIEADKATASARCGWSALGIAVIAVVTLLSSSPSMGDGWSHKKLGRKADFDTNTKDPKFVQLEMIEKNRIISWTPEMNAIYQDRLGSVMRGVGGQRCGQARSLLQHSLGGRLRSTDEAIELLNGRPMLMIGDSLVRGTFGALCSIVNG